MALIQEEFEKYYESIFQERWATLRDALVKPERQVRRYNRFADFPRSLPSEGAALTGGTPSSASPGPTAFIDWLPLSQWHERVEAIERTQDELLRYYILDPASVLVAENLTVQPGEKVLDLCAAPGGKSLVLAQNLFSSPSPQSELILNELSGPRRDRLIKVIQQYVPREIRQQIWVSGKDGVRFGLEKKEYFDAILLDAPCSGERHLLNDKKELMNWSIKRTKGLAQKQYALLSSAWLALKPGGRLMYSTCALSPLENDGLIERFLTKMTKKMTKTMKNGANKIDSKSDRDKSDSGAESGKGVIVESLKFQGPGAEATDHGILYLPDQSGFGPMYSCILRKPI